MKPGQILVADHNGVYIIKMLQGSYKGLQDPSSIFISQSLAQTLFGNDDPMNKIVKIDNKPFYGNYGDMPANHIQSLIVLVDKDTVAIPPAAYTDLCNVNFTYRDKSGTERSNNGIYLSKDKRKIYVYLLNKDGQGGYEVTWVIQDKKFLRRVLDYGMIK